MIYAKTRPKIRFLLIISMLIAFFFLLESLIMSSPVELSEAIQTEVHYESYKAIKGKRGISSFYLHFSDHQNLEIHQHNVTDSLIRHLNELQPGTKLTLLLHPRSSTILSIHSGSLEILNFDAAAHNLTATRQELLIQSVFCCCVSIYCAIWLHFHPKPKNPSPLL